MNKLCCEVSTRGHCLACGQKWCDSCGQDYGWEPENGRSHSGLKRKTRAEGSPLGEPIWKCPVAGMVTFALLENEDNPLDAGWEFVAYTGESFG